MRSGTPLLPVVSKRRFPAEPCRDFSAMRPEAMTRHYQKLLEDQARREIDKLEGIFQKPTTA
jgi:hypothetical protein